MANKKKTKSKPKASETSATKRTKPATKRTKKSSNAKPTRSPRKTVKKKQSKKKASSVSLPKKRSSKPVTPRTPKKKSSASLPASKQNAPRTAIQRPELAREKKGAAEDRQSGDLVGLSRIEEADSESVEELVEEGNVFEAGAVAGVEEADDEETSEVHTREFSEDDVPEEYLDKD